MRNRIRPLTSPEIGGRNPRPRLAVLEGGLRIEYEVHGEWSTSEQTVLLVPGLGHQGLTNYWAVGSLIHHLVSLGLCVIRFNQRDTGGSTFIDKSPSRMQLLLAKFRCKCVSFTPPYDVFDLVQDIVLFLDYLGLSTCHIVGAGYGGVEATVFALLHGAKCSSLTLIRTPALLLQEERVNHALLSCSRPSSSVSVKEKVMFLAARERRIATPGGMYDGGSLSDQAYQKLQAIGRMLGPTKCPLAKHEEGLRRQEIAFQALRDDAISLERFAGLLQSFVKPVLVVHGDEDEYVPIANALSLFGSIPTAELLVLHGIRHDLPDFFGEVVSHGILRQVQRSEGAEPTRMPAASKRAPFTFKPVGSSGVEIRKDQDEADTLPSLHFKP